MERWDRFTEWLGEEGRLFSALKVLAFVAAFCALLVFFAYQVGEQPATGPCAADAYPARCYHVKPEVCKVMWSHSEATCNEHVQKLALRPGVPHGPTLMECTQALFDEAFPYSRKGTRECEERHRDLETWRKQNLQAK